MKKIGIGVFALFIFLTGCQNNVDIYKPVDKPALNQSSEDITINILQGNNWRIGDESGYYKIEASSFSDLKAGGKIEFEFEPMPDTTYTRVICKDTDSKNLFFSNVSCSPEPYYVSQDKNGSAITKIAVADYDSSSYVSYRVTITVTESEASNLKEKGLILTGYNMVLKDIKLYTTKDVYGKDLTFEQQYDLFKEYRESIIQKYSRGYKVPMIFITTEGREDVRKKEYYNSMIDVVNCDSSYKLSAPGQVKVRGNSTADDRWSPNQKPLRIKFEDKQSMLGLHGGKKYKSWVLLKAEGFKADDYLGFNLAHEIYKTSKFSYYASDCTFVHVFVNDEYKGQYLLCEQNQVNGGRVAVDENKSGSKDNKIGYMIELDNYTWEDLKDGKGHWFGNGCSKGAEDYHFDVSYLSEDEEDNIEFEVWGYKQTGVKLTDINGETRGCISDSFTLKNDVYSEEQVQFIHDYTAGLWEICYKAIEKGIYCKFDSDYNVVPAPEFTSAKEVCEALIDMESLCNEMILEELVRDNDVGAGSLYMAIDFTKVAGEKYNKFTFECPWDFNWAYQSISSDMDGGAYWKGKTQYFAGAWQTLELLEDHYDRSHPWFVLFNKADWFRQMMRDKWNQIGKDNLKQVANNVEKIAAAAGKDINKNNGTYYANFIKNRVDYIDKYLWK